ncbi:MAG: hypothetical protein KJ072_22125 [Verrucomicrobia bacterium]|nr:hypothetical protein [Verrucomicrobiota bacterium]
MRYPSKLYCIVARGLASVAILGAVWAQAQTTIPESVALPSSALDTTKPGFVVRVFQATGPALASSIARAEDQIAGFLINPATGQPFENIANPALFNADGTYDEFDFISYGVPPAADYPFPGIPGTDNTVLNIAMEAITFVDLQPGTYTMVVNSDDGFRVTTGNPYDRVSELVLGEFDGARGAADTVFSFTVTKAGVYPFRLTYLQGDGEYKLAWFMSSDPAQPVLLNDFGGIASYRALKAGSVTSGPTISAVSPLPNAANASPSSGLTALIRDGTTPLNVASVRLFRNGVDITANATIGPKSGNTTKVSYRPDDLPEPLSVQEYKLVYSDPTATGGTREALINYTVSAYANLTLPDPIWKETFDNIPEGSMPTGWTTVTPFAVGANMDLNDPNSDAYWKWVVISRDRVASITAWNASQRLNTPEVYVNGVKVPSLIENQFAYHESDVRSGSQYAELFSPEVNLTGQTDIYVVYHSIYTQNQDNVAGLEYSIDGGTTWLPVVYMIDKDDLVLKGDGSIDAEATLAATRNDTAVYTDPVLGQVGLSYGAFVKATPSTWPDLAPYISGRINDDQMESKRIEKFRLPQADNQSRVKLRFFQAGTASWFFGVDNVGFYSIQTIDPPQFSKQPASATRVPGGWIKFEVTAIGEQLTYQWQKDQVDITGATDASYLVDPVTLASAGAYRCVVTNPGGTANSQDAVLTVVQAPQDVESLQNGLGAYLPFENDYADASGNNRNGTPVGNPTFAAGQVGTAAVRVTNQGESRNFVTLGQAASSAFGQTTDFTVAFWMKTERVSSDPVVVGNKDWDSGGNTGWLIGTQSDGRIEWNYKRSTETRKDLDYTDQGPILNSGRWAHVTVVWNINGDALTYYDGFLVNQQPISPGNGDIAAAGTSLNLGQDGMGDYGSEWDGLLDDVAFWSRALTADEVLALYGTGLRGFSFLNPPPPQPTLAYSLAGGQLTLTWQGEGFALQENGNLGDPAGWSNVQGAGANSATVPTATGTKFYRLKK